jgi:hypothetical protein
MTFRSFDDALFWGKKYGRENCRPCDTWKIVQVGMETFMIAIEFKASGRFVGYAS